MVPVLNLINDSMSAASSWFVRIFSSSGMTEVYISIIFIIFGIKFIISPVLGRSRGSDRARTNKGEDSSNE